MADTAKLHKIFRWPVRLMRRLVIRGLSFLPAKGLLRFLLQFDNWLYYLQGQTAIRYGDGLHPKHRILRYHDFFVARIKSGERVLDIGCGVGAVAHDVAIRSSAIVTGIDINPHNIAQAEKRHSHSNVQYLVGDVLKMLPEEPFDVIILSNVLEHLSERPGFLRKVGEITDAKRFLIRVPNYERDWRVPLKLELGVEWRLDPTHETEHTLEAFAAEIAQANLKIVHQEIRWGEIWAVATPNAVRDAIPI